MEQITCSCCGCSWDKNSGYYHCKGELRQPCRECQLDAKSIRYLNNRESILEAQRNAWYKDHEASKARNREYKRSRSAQATA